MKYKYLKLDPTLLSGLDRLNAGEVEGAVSDVRDAFKGLKTAPARAVGAFIVAGAQNTAALVLMKAQLQARAKTLKLKGTDAFSLSHICEASIKADPQDELANMIEDLGAYESGSRVVARIRFALAPKAPKGIKGKKEETDHKLTLAAILEAIEGMSLTSVNKVVKAALETQAALKAEKAEEAV